MNTCTNLPNSRWGLTKKKPLFVDSKAGKENSSSWEQKSKEHPQNTSTTQRKCHNSPATPPVPRMKTSLMAETPMMMANDNVREKVYDKELVFAHETAKKIQMQYLSPLLIDSGEESSVVCIEDSLDNSLQNNSATETSDVPSSSDSISRTEQLRRKGNKIFSNISVSSGDSSLYKGEGFQLMPTFTLPNNLMVSPLLGTINNNTNLCQSTSSGAPCITSTPLEVTHLRNSSCGAHAEGENFSASEKSNSSNISLRNCEILLQPLQITPTLQRRADRIKSQTSSGNESSLNSSVSDHGLVPSTHEVSSLQEGNGRTALRDTPDETGMNSQSGQKQSSLLKECVVSLERLRLTPLIKDRKRLTGACSGMSTETTGMQSPRIIRSHLSFMVKSHFCL